MRGPPAHPSGKGKSERFGAPRAAAPSAALVGRACRLKPAVQAGGAIGAGTGAPGAERPGPAS